MKSKAPFKFYLCLAFSFFAAISAKAQVNQIIVEQIARDAVSVSFSSNFYDCTVHWKESHSPNWRSHHCNFGDGILQITHLHSGIWEFRVTPGNSNFSDTYYGRTAYFSVSDSFGPPPPPPPPRYYTPPPPPQKHYAPVTPPPHHHHSAPPPRQHNSPPPPHNHSSAPPPPHKPSPQHHASPPPAQHHNSAPPPRQHNSPPPSSNHNPPPPPRR